MTEQLEARLREMAAFATSLPAGFRGLTDQDRDDIRAAADALAAMREDRERLGRVIDFFASVIKSGESWTATCQTEFNNARRIVLGGEHE